MIKPFKVTSFVQQPVAQLPKEWGNHFPEAGKMVMPSQACHHFVGINKMVAFFRLNDRFVGINKMMGGFLPGENG